MKKKILLMLAVGVSALAVADEPEALNVEKTDQSLVSTKLNDVRSIAFSADESTMQVVKTNAEVAAIALDDVRKITFGDYHVTPEESTALLAPENATFAIYGKDEIRIDCPDGIRSVRLYNVGGQLLFTTKSNENSQHVQFSTSNLPNGVYVVLVESTKAKISQKVIIQ